MGILIRLIVVGGVAFFGYGFVKDKVPEVKDRVFEFTKPEEKRAILIDELESRLEAIDEVVKEADEINLENIEDEETKNRIRSIITGAEAIQESKDLLENIERLNEKDGPLKDGLSNILDKIAPQFSNPPECNCSEE